MRRRAPQRLRFVDAITRRDKGDRPAIQHLIDQQIHQHTCPLDRHIRGAHLALCLARTCHICQVERLSSITAKT
jgi:hypothetical protein